MLTRIGIAESSQSSHGPTRSLSAAVPEKSQIRALKDDGHETYEGIDNEEGDNSHQKPFVELVWRNAQQEKSNGDFDCGDRPEVDGLSYKIELQADRCCGGIQVCKMAAGTIHHLWNNDAHPSYGEHL